MRKIVFVCLNLFLFNVGASSHPLFKITKTANEHAFKINRLYADNKGMSHFDIVYLEPTQYYLKTKNSTLAATSLVPADAFQLLSFPTSYQWDWHTPPAKSRYFELVLSGSESITASDGTTKILNPGDMILFEDNTGKGHQATGKHGTSLVIKIS